jgi:hypothetical protein
VCAAAILSNENALCKTDNCHYIHITCHAYTSNTRKKY